MPPRPSSYEVDKAVLEEKQLPSAIGSEMSFVMKMLIFKHFM